MIKSSLKYILWLFAVVPCLTLPGFSLTLGQSVLINEFLAANDTTMADEDGDFSDWIELYNPTATPVNLAGFTLTDDFADSLKWSFPSVLIGPGQFLLVWASNKDRKTPNHLHSNFKLNKSGEGIGLFAPGGQVADTIRFGPQQTDLSTGRLPDAGRWTEFLLPSPALPNQTLLPIALFSLESGFYNGAISLLLSGPDSISTVRYTLDGSDISGSSSVVTGPILLTQTTAVRAAVFQANGAHGQVVTKTYLINENLPLPIISLVTDPKNLWDKTTGIFVNYEERGDAWERPVQAALFENSGIAFDLLAGLRVHGSASRVYPKKSSRLHFRSDYGVNSLTYPVFPNYSIQEFDCLVLHAGGEDQLFYPGRWTLIKNALMTVLSQKTHSLVTASRPASIFLNGRFWGIYHLRERIGNAFIKSRFGFEDMDLLKGNTTDTPDVEEGSTDHWQQMFAFFESHDLKDSLNYLHACQLIDSDNFTDYTIIGAFSGDHDWPHNNFYTVRRQSGDDRWRWIAWDSDHAFGNHYKENVTLNSIEWITRDHPMPELKLFGSADREKYLWATLMLRRLLENPGYRNYFLSRFADLLNSTLGPETTVRQADSLATLVAAGIPSEMAKWGSEAHINAQLNWNQNIQFMKNYLHQRPEVLRSYLAAKFNLSGTNLLTLAAPEGAGRVRINTITPVAYPWQGAYFRDVPITLRAEPAPGYIFLRWSDPGLPARDSITVYLNGDRSFQPIFIDAAQPEIVAQPNPCNFGRIVIKSIGIMHLEVSNNGQKVLNVSHFRITGSNASEFYLPKPDTSFMLAVNARDTLEIWFRPVSYGKKNALLIIENNDPFQPFYQVTLTGTGSKVKPVSQLDLALDSAFFKDNRSESIFRSDDFTIDQENLTAAATIQFTDITNSSHTAGYSSSGYGHGVSFADVNQDGRIDLLVSNAIRDQILPDHLFMNQGNNIFTDQAAARGTEDLGLTHAIVSADIDNDGDLDAFFADMPENDTSPEGRNVLYRNDGTGNYTNITDWAGISNENNGTRGAIALDIDNDGDLDLYAVNWGEPNEMYINDGTGQMTREDRGANGPTENPDEFGQQGVTSADVDNDGDVDLYVCRRQEGDEEAPNWLFINDGTGYFTDQAAARGVAVGGRTNGAAFADVDTDGDLDLFVVNYAYKTNELPPLGVFFNRGDGTFEDRSDSYDIHVSGYSVAFGDVDNDADPDMFLVRNDQKEPNARPELYLNDGSGHFARQVNSGIEVAAADTRGAGLGDIDSDGDLDFYIACAKSYNFLLRNDTQSGNHFIDILCLGPLGDLGGYGTRVQVFQQGHLGDPDYLLGYQQVVSNYSYLCQDQTALHFGLGSLTACDIRLIRTDGRIIDYPAVTADQVFKTVNIAEFSGAPVSGSAPLTVTFTDHSTGDINSWSWSFPGAEPANASGKGPHSVTYPSPGNFDVELTVNGRYGSDTEQKAQYISVAGGNFKISGTVNYYFSTLGVAQTIIDLTASGESLADTTDANGDYQFDAISSGSVELKPFRHDDQGDAISGSDALLVLQYLAFLIELTPDQRYAADVTEDVNVTGSDAQAILRYLAFYTDNIASTGQWRFDPADSAFTLLTNSLVNFKAFLLGDVTGDWGAQAGPARLSRPEESGSAALVRITAMEAKELNQVLVTIMLENPQEPVNTVILSLEYEHAYLKYQETVTTALSQDFMLAANGTEAGKLHVAMAGVNGVVASGGILQMKFEKIGSLPLAGQAQIKISRALVNDQICAHESRAIDIDPSGGNGIPTCFNLAQSYPNPFSLTDHSATIVLSYQLPLAAEVVVTIYNIEGKLIRRIHVGLVRAGHHQVVWDGTSEAGKVATGLYFYQVTAGSFKAMKKLLVIR